jgi:hypothetical protein
MKKLKADLPMIEAAMEDVERDYNEYFLDKDTGEVIILTEEVTGYAEEQELRDDLPEWMLNQIKIAKEILIENPERYINIPMKPLSESYKLMVEFADSVTDELLREKLNIALVGKGAFHRFKMVLIDYPFYKQKWFQFKEQKLKIEILDWLRSIGIEAIE